MNKDRFNWFEIKEDVEMNTPEMGINSGGPMEGNTEPDDNTSNQGQAPGGQASMSEEEEDQILHQRILSIL